MANNAWIFCLLILLVAVSGAKCACPTRCSCSGTDVTCSSLTSIPVDIPVSAIKLYLKAVSFTTIPAQAFSYLTNLEYLEISSGSIENLDSFAFSGLNVTSMSFIGCSIDTLASYSFSGLASIESVQFKSVSISYIQSHAFHDMPSLGSLQFETSSIDEIQPKAINGIGHSLTLTWHSTSVDVFKGQAVSDLTLARINFIGSSIDTFESEAFSNVTQIDAFIIEKSSISKMKARAISNINRIKLLRWSNSSFGDLESFAISQNDKIDSIFVDHVCIGHLSSFAFNDTSTDATRFQNVGFGKLDEGTIEYLHDSANNSFIFSPVNVTCNRNVCWMFQTNNSRYLQTTFSKVKCFIPHEGVEAGFGSLYGAPKKDLPFGCSSCDYSNGFSCNIDVSTDDFTCSARTSSAGQHFTRIPVYLLTLMWLLTVTTKVG